MAESSDASMLSSDSSEGSVSSDKDQSSDEEDVVSEKMETTNLRGDKGMWRLTMFGHVWNLQGTPIFHARCLGLFANTHSQFFVWRSIYVAFLLLSDLSP